MVFAGAEADPRSVAEVGSKPHDAGAFVITVFIR